MQSATDREVNFVEIEKQTLYLNFINDLSTQILNVQDQESIDFIEKYSDAFLEIQGKFLTINRNEDLQAD